MNRLQKLQELLRRSPENTFARYGLAMEYRSQGNLELARQVFSELMQQTPDYLPLYFQFGSTLRELAEIEEAGRVFKEGIRMAEVSQDFHARDELRAALDDLEE